MKAFTNLLLRKNNSIKKERLLLYSKKNGLRQNGKIKSGFKKAFGAQTL